MKRLFDSGQLEPLTIPLHFIVHGAKRLVVVSDPVRGLLGWMHGQITRGWRGKMRRLRVAGRSRT
jgi:hypothetical protein